MIEIGQVIENKGQQVLVRIQRKKACEHCGMCEKGQEGMEITLDNTLGALPEDWVQISMGDRMVLNASVIVYAIPLIFLLVGVALGYIISSALGLANRDLIAAVSGIGSTVLSYIVVRFIDKKISGRQDYIPQITRIIDKER